MKRFKIKNKANGLEFQIEREELGPLQPEWGKPERPEYDSKGKPTGRMLPPQFTIIEEDITEEIEAKQTKEEKRKQRKARDLADLVEKAKDASKFKSQDAVEAVRLMLLDKYTDE